MKHRLLQLLSNVDKVSQPRKRLKPGTLKSQFRVSTDWANKPQVEPLTLLLWNLDRQHDRQGQNWNKVCLPYRYLLWKTGQLELFFWLNLIFFSRSVVLILTLGLFPVLLLVKNLPTSLPVWKIQGLVWANQFFFNCSPMQSASIWVFYYGDLPWAWCWNIL